MLNYINAELYRYTHKKSTYIYYAILIFLICLVFTLGNFSNSGKMDAKSMIDLGIILTSFLPIFIGIHVYLTVYNDDLNSKGLSNVISTGTSKLAIPIAKFLVSIITMLIGYLIMATVYFIIYFIIFKGFGNLTGDMLNSILLAALIRFISTLGFFALSNIITFAFQKSSLSLVFVITVTLGVANQILSLLTLISSDLTVITDNTLTSLTSSAASSIMDGSAFPNEFYLMAAVYIVVSLVVATYIFKKRDVEVS